MKKGKKSDSNKPFGVNKETKSTLLALQNYGVSFKDVIESNTAA